MDGPATVGINVSAGSMPDLSVWRVESVLQLGNVTRVYRSTRTILEDFCLWPEALPDFFSPDPCFAGISPNTLRMAEDNPFRPCRAAIISLHGGPLRVNNGDAVITRERLYIFRLRLGSGPGDWGSKFSTSERLRNFFAPTMIVVNRPLFTNSEMDCGLISRSLAASACEIQIN
jgi:hypothetical protein